METYIQMAIVMKLSMLKRNSNPNFTYEQLEDILYNDKWKEKIPSSISNAVNDIMSISGDELIQFLSKQAVIQSHQISDFSDLLGGHKNEY
ncbi:MAG: hypothetical protein GX675_02595 [Erysipelotrichaceae bacterium]|nr:hypothetical protein [Erysipelotrichaceae bacterium]